MKKQLFDAHGDIWSDVTIHSLKGERDIFRKYHLDKFKKGNVFGGTFVMWIDPPYDEIQRNVSNKLKLPYVRRLKTQKIF